MKNKSPYLIICWKITLLLPFKALHNLNRIVFWPSCEVFLARWYSNCSYFFEMCSCIIIIEGRGRNWSSVIDTVYLQVFAHRVQCILIFRFAEHIRSRKTHSPIINLVGVDIDDENRGENEDDKHQFNKCWNIIEFVGYTNKMVSFVLININVQCYNVSHFILAIYPTWYWNVSDIDRYAEYEYNLRYILIWIVQIKLYDNAMQKINNPIEDN